MQQQEDAAWTRHRAIPPVEAYTIMRLKRHILALQPCGVPLVAGRAGREKDEALFKKHG